METLARNYGLNNQEVSSQHGQLLVITLTSQKLMLEGSSRLHIDVHLHERGPSKLGKCNFVPLLHKIAAACRYTQS